MLGRRETLGDRRRLSLTCGALLALLLAGLACQKPPPKTVVYDLAAAAHAAEITGPWEAVLFGTPAAGANENKGLLEGAAESQTDIHAPSLRKVRVLLRWAAPAPRAALLDLAPFPGVPNQGADVFLNGQRVASLTLRDGRRRYLVPLPATGQKRDVNWLRLGFARGTPSKDPDDPPRAALLYGLWIAPASDAALTDLTAEGAPPPLSFDHREGSPTLVQAVPGELSFVIRLPKAAELAFTPRLHPTAAAGGVGFHTFRVSVKSDARDAQEIWRGEVRTGGPRQEEVRVPIPGAPGSIVRLGLGVGQPGQRRAWGLWSAPRILGRGPGDPLPPAPLESRHDRAAGSLRRSLAGSSVLLLVLDAASARHFSCYGYPRRTTPEIDRIASEGVLYERAYTPAAYTLMAMSSLWTSQYPGQHHNGVPPSSPLPRDRLTLAELLSAQGVHTSGFVANVSAGPAFGLERGFAEFHLIYDSRRRPGAASGADDLGEAVSPWMRAQAGRRFFAYVHLREPHFPYDPPPPFNTMFGPDAPLPREVRRDEGKWVDAVNSGRVTPSPDEIDHLVRLYDANLAFADQQLGLLRREMEAAGLWDKTVVLITADHGETMYEHGRIGHNQQLYEPTLRIPLIVRFPRGHGPAGLRVKGLADLLDVAPTIADVMGLLGKGGSDREFQGRSLLPAAVGAPGKTAVGSISTWEDLRYSLTEDRYKLIHNIARGDVELYDLERDPEEREDLSEREPLRTAFYRQALARWWLAMKRGRASAPLPTSITREERERLRALGYVK